MSKIIYFAYGANLSLAGMAMRCPGHVPISSAVLPDHRVVFRGVADIEPAEGEKVYGALYELTRNHLRALDRFEGFPHLYIRKKVIVTTEAGEKVSAIAYVMTKQRGYAEPTIGYLKIIITGCFDWNLPEEHIYALINRAKSPVK